MVYKCTCFPFLSQIGPSDADKLSREAELDFIAHVGSSSAFQRLRTEEGLGYVVSCFPRRGPPPTGVLGLSVIVQSPNHSPSYLEGRVEAWLAAFRDELAAMPVAEFANVVSALVAACHRREAHMAEEAERHWGALAAGAPHEWARRFRKAEAYAALTKEAVLSLVDGHLARGAPARRKLSVHVSGHAPAHAAEATADGAAAGASTAEAVESETGCEAAGMPVLAEADAPELEAPGIVMSSLANVREFKASLPLFE
ncbi:unnamed protein product [Phaeothamnion confervicola]